MIRPKTTGITAEERRIRSDRLLSRVRGICEGFDAGASVDAKEQQAEIGRLESCIHALKLELSETKKALQMMLDSTAFHASYCESIPGFNDKACNCALGKARQAAKKAMEQRNG